MISALILAEIAEAIPSIIDATTLQFLKQYEEYIEYIHISDQYSGVRPKELVYSYKFSKLSQFTNFVCIL